MVLILINLIVAMVLEIHGQHEQPHQEKFKQVSMRVRVWKMLKDADR